MANKMLIDAAHPEETRVVVLRGSRVEEFDFEAASKKQLRGNIYLAKVTRVEPSLQAAFVDYGGNRHGFLAFSEIHPDYYQIPVSDRQALIEAEAHEEPEEEEEKPPRRSRRHRRDRSAPAAMHREDAAVSEAAPVDEADARPVQAAETPPYDDPTPDLIERAGNMHEQLDAGAPDKAAIAEAMPVEIPPSGEQGQTGGTVLDSEAVVPTEPQPGVDEGEPVGPIVSDAQVDTGSPDTSSAQTHADERSDAGLGEGEGSEGEFQDRREGAETDDESDGEQEEDVSEHVEQLGGDAMEEIPMRAQRSNRRQYKIQEVIKRRQVLLVQVVKEERGNKGAALTTYLSLAGRYSVLMPNTAKGGGISRKITDAGDRQRLKTIAQDLEVPDGMGVILRTAGASRTKPEVKRDFEYLMRMWETVRETTLGSQAPTLVYEEGSLIKRAIRDLYNKDVEEVVVAGEAGYREAKDFMRLLMPSHARNVQLWRDPQPIFAKAGAEAQLDAMFSSHVTLRSGGYLVINQTEALVAIDVNSGRSTREHNIEDTALRTNLEAADEVARQLRLRDLAGLIVVDFIDMEEGRNNRAVEKRIKDALKNDRARIQVGRISHFGLLEMSRQRIRTGVLEGSTVVCEHCAGAGMVRSTSSIALHVLRLLEDALISDASHDLVVKARSIIALYILNQKRQHLGDLEGRFGVVVAFAADEALTGTTYCMIERGEPASGVPLPVHPLPAYDLDPAVEDEVVEMEDEPVEAEPGGEAEAGPEPTDAEGQRRKRRRRRRGRDRESSGIAEDAPQPADDALAFVGDVDAARIEADGADAATGEDTDGRPARGEGRRRRSRRGGRRSSREDSPASTEAAAAPETDDADLPLQQAHVEPEILTQTVEAADEQAPHVASVAQAEPATVPEEPPTIAAAAQEMVSADRPAEAAPSMTPAEESVSKRPELLSSEADPAQPKRSGWWQRAKATLGG